MSLGPETERRILQCVDEVLEALGKSEAQIFISYLARSFGLKKKVIPRKPEQFSKGLNLIFGEQAANVLETAIVQKLLTSLGIDLTPKLTLAEAIVIVKAEREKFS
jgi:ABC-type dipeptide/oligopeptide/nickel transport system ATPase subunit